MRKAALFGVALVVALLVVGPASGVCAEDPLALDGQTICLDPGHGGSDPGAVNGDLHESDINLDVANGLKGLLETEGAMVVMTRTGDQYLTNRDRYTFCNSAGATLLISVHTNSVSDLSWDGSQTLYFKSVDLPLAQAVQGVMYPYLQETAPAGVSFQDFGLNKYASGVLLKSEMPAIMAEPLFMSHPEEAELLVQPIYEGGSLSGGCSSLQCRRGQIAQAIYEGILSYVATGGGDGDDGGDDGGKGGPPCASPPCRR